MSLIHKSLPWFILGMSTAAYANTSDEQRVAERLNDQRILAEEHQVAPQPMAQAPVQAVKKSQKSVSMSKEQLAQHPDLVVRALLPAVMQNNADNVALLYPIYQNLPATYQDPLLAKWAAAILAKQAQQYEESIRLYREILAQQSDATLVRLQLAIALFENNEIDAAEDQFHKLGSEPLPAALKQGVEQYLAAISHKDRWTFNGGLTYLNDPNINNAPKSGTRFGNWSAPESESAQGVGFNADIGKKWSWGNGFFNELRLDASGKYYWNNKKYNEMSLRGSLGLGYQNARNTVVVLPFMEQTLYAGGGRSETLKRFSKAGGVTLEWRYWLSPKWQWSSTYEYAEQRYTERKHLNGNYHFVSTGLTYLANAKQYWGLSVNYNRTATRDKDDSYLRRGVNLFWGQEWGKGFSTRLGLSYAQKRYKAPMPIFNLTQRNREYGITLSLWHRAVHFWGITPRLSYQFNRVKSNHSFYTYDKQRVFVDFSKQF